MSNLAHVRRVQSLYKRALRNLESWYDRRLVEVDFCYRFSLMFTKII